MLFLLTQYKKSTMELKENNANKWSKKWLAISNRFILIAWSSTGNAAEAVQANISAKAMK